MLLYTPFNFVPAHIYLPLFTRAVRHWQFRVGVYLHAELLLSREWPYSLELLAGSDGLSADQYDNDIPTDASQVMW